MIITNKLGFAIAVVVGVLLAVLLLGLCLVVIARSVAEVKEKKTKQNGSSATTTKPTLSSGAGCSQLIALLLGIILLWISILL